MQTNFTLKKSDPKKPFTYFSRAGRASLTRFKILMDKEKILNREKIYSVIPKVKSHPVVHIDNLNKMISTELENIKNNKPKITSNSLSATFKSPGRKDFIAQKESPSLGAYDLNYSLVEKNPVFYSIPRTKKYPELPKPIDSFLSSNLHQFPDQNYKGIPFECQTSRKDILEGLPLPHDERFVVHNLLPKSCSKFLYTGSPSLGKYTERHDFYQKKEFSPDYKPNKEFVLPKITHNIKFQSMTDRKPFIEEIEWPSIFDINMPKQEKKKNISQLSTKKDEITKNSQFIKEKRSFSPSKFLEYEPASHEV